MITINLHKKLHSTVGEMQLEVDLNIQPETFLTLYGKSGAGKTSVLRMLAGLMPPDQGFISVGEQVWLDTSEKINWSPQLRNPGFVFQDYALFPNMTVQENLEFALHKGQKNDRIKELVELVELGDLRHQKPATLSGGQQQRVALARALVQKPKLLMLDEPLSALDLEMRTKLQHYLLRLHQEYKLTTILVSHDIPEILAVSNRVVQMEQGKIIKDGHPNELLQQYILPSNLPANGELIKVEKQGQLLVLTIKVGAQQMKIKVTKDDSVKWFR